jgi:hypothetical protein
MVCTVIRPFRYVLVLLLGAGVAALAGALALAFNSPHDPVAGAFALAGPAALLLLLLVLAGSALRVRGHPRLARVAIVTVTIVGLVAGLTCTGWGAILLLGLPFGLFCGEAGNYCMQLLQHLLAAGALYVVAGLSLGASAILAGVCDEIVRRDTLHSTK